MHYGRWVKGAIALMAAAVLGLLAGPAAAWWQPDWAFRKVITLEAGPAGANAATAVTDLPVLLRLHTGNFPYFLDVREGGADMRALSGDDLTPLKLHVESWDPINELGFVWVRLPRLDPAAPETVHLYYGNLEAPPGGEPAAVVDAETVLWLSFEETAGLPRDRTAFENHPGESGAERNGGSLIGGGLRFEPSQRLLVPNTPSLVVAAEPGFTASLWLKPRLDAAPAAPVAVAAGEGGAGEDGTGAEGAGVPVARPAALAPGDAAILALDGNGPRIGLLLRDGALVLSALDAAGMPSEAPPAALRDGVWQHLAVVLEGLSLRLYVDGREAAALALPEPLSFPARLVLGAPEGSARGFAGEVDDVRLATVARSAAWLALVAMNQGSGDRLATYGADESRDSAGGGFHTGSFGIIFGHVFGTKEAIVEQAVIVICGIMATIALLVMFFKQVFLGRARGATRRFLAAYRAMLDGQSGDTEAAVTGLNGLYEAHHRYGDSPLFRVYRLGMDEVNRRVGTAVGAQAAGLDDKAITSVKAAMDSAMVRERQRMDSQMVLLTIAISGGPFIGLLGTVVGVMVTFAAISQAGDVNITAIAPGMATALLATVAGLTVAIPALFGYNYLGSRIKELTADMHVFGDELLSRINETYGR